MSSCAKCKWLSLRVCLCVVVVCICGAPVPSKLRALTGPPRITVPLPTAIGMDQLLNINLKDVRFPDFGPLKKTLRPALELPFPGFVHTSVRICHAGWTNCSTSTARTCALNDPRGHLTGA